VTTQYVVGAPPSAVRERPVQQRTTDPLLTYGDPTWLSAAPGRADVQSDLPKSDCSNASAFFLPSGVKTTDFAALTGLEMSPRQMAENIADGGR
jgi:hypothetical protein